MKQRKAIRFLTLPLLTAWGLTLLALGGLVPLIGIAVSLPAVVILFLLAVLGLIYIYRLFVECRLTRQIVERLTIDPKLPPHLYSGVDTVLQVNLSAADISSPFTLYLRPESPPETTAEKQIYTVEIPAASSAITVEHHFQALTRGPLRWSKIYCRLQLPAALGRWQFTITLKPSLERIVLPNQSCFGKRQIKAFQKEHTGNLLAEHFRGEGREFDVLRPYAVGDDLRKVDWKHSAKGRGLFVKVFRPETHQRINIAIDCGRRMGSRIGGRLQIEYAADAAASLIRLARCNEDDLGLFAFNHQVVSKIHCQKGKKQEKMLLDALVNLEIGELEADFQLLTEWARFNRRRSLLILITSISNPAGLEQIRSHLPPLRRKHLPLVFALADADLKDLVYRQAANLEDAFMISAGMEQALEIEARAISLKKSGIDCVYCDVAELPARLEQKYRELKLSGRL